MSISSDDNNIKLYNNDNGELILNLNKVYNKGYLFSACFLKENNENFIATSNLEWNNYFEPIKIYDFNGNKIKDINDSKDKAIEY